MNAAQRRHPASILESSLDGNHYSWLEFKFHLWSPAEWITHRHGSAYHACMKCWLLLNKRDATGLVHAATVNSIIDSRKTRWEVDRVLIFFPIGVSRLAAMLCSWGFLSPGWILCGTRIPYLFRMNTYSLLGCMLRMADRPAAGLSRTANSDGSYWGN